MKVAYLDWSLSIECPNCHCDNNLADDDDDAVVASAIFHNNWDALKGFERECKFCKHEIKVESVEY